MKLQNFLIGIGVFALFTIIIFGAINTDNPEGIYSENYLNITHDSNTSKAIANISGTGSSVKDDYSSTESNIRGTNTTLTGELNEASFFQQSWRVIKTIPNSFTPVGNVLGMLGAKIGVPPEFTTWVMSAIVIIIGLMIVTAFLRNKLQS